MASDLEWALANYSHTSRRRQYAAYALYYDGKHPLAFATEAWRTAFGATFKKFADNLCPAVVDSLTERLKIVGWRSDQAQTRVEDVPSGEPGIPARKKVTVDDPLGDAVWDLWVKNQMASRANKVHKEAIKEGDSYLLIWPNRKMEAEFWPQTALEMAVEYNPNVLGEITRASKVWYLPVSKRWRLNIYFSDRIDKYITTREHPNGVPDAAGDWSPGTDDGSPSTVPNPYGRVPVFHFANKACYELGDSDLKDVTPIQDALNKSVMDMLVAMEFSSYKQRYIIGMEVEVDENTGEPTDQNVKGYGVNRMMSIPGEKDEVAVGQFEATDLGQFLQVSEKFRAQVARVSGTPLHYFYITSGDFPSGEAIKSAEARFVARIESRQEDWGPQWGRAVRFGLQMEQAVDDSVLFSPFWKDASPRSEAETADTVSKKKAIGVSRSQSLKELGYDDDTIAMMLEESDALAISQASLAATSRGPDIAPPASENGAPNSAGGGGTASRLAATQARTQGNIPGVSS